jgi:hypothetical protein
MIKSNHASEEVGEMSPIDSAATLKMEYPGATSPLRAHKRQSVMR